MTNGPNYRMNMTSKTDAEIEGRLLAIEIVLGQLIFEQENSREILGRLETAGDGIETGYASNDPLVRTMGAACRQTMERLAGIVATLESHDAGKSPTA